MIHKHCRKCGQCKALSQYERITAGKYRNECKPCRNLYNAAMQAKCRERKRLGVLPEQPDRSYVPPTDFLCMGEPDRSVALTWRIAA